jgi:hypothetical protein
VQSGTAFCCRDECCSSGVPGEDRPIAFFVSECSIERIRTSHGVDPVAVEGELLSMDDQQRRVRPGAVIQGKPLISVVDVNKCAFLAVVVSSSSCVGGVDLY